MTEMFVGRDVYKRCVQLEVCSTANGCQKLVPRTEVRVPWLIVEVKSKLRATLKLIIGQCSNLISRLK